MTPNVYDLYAACEGTWPPARIWEAHGATLRDGQGGGKRVSAATTDQVSGPDALSQLEHDMRDVGQSPLFMIREGDDVLDQTLAANGYDVIDPVNMYLAPIDALTDRPIPPVTCFEIWPPLAMMAEIWSQGGIGADRLAVMDRAKTKTGILARWNEKPAGVAFAGLHQHICMVHAVEVLTHQRRQGVAQWMMRKAAVWAQQNGAEWISVLCVKENVPANRLYQRLGFEASGAYHYRIKGKT